MVDSDIGAQETETQVVGLPSLVVGPPGSNYPILTGSTTGDVQINAAIVAANKIVTGTGAGPVTVVITGGAGVTYTISAQIVPLEGVPITSDGAILKCVSGWTAGPMFDNRGATTPTLTNLEFAGLSLNANAANNGYTSVAGAVIAVSPWTLGGASPTVAYPTLSPVTTITVALANTGGISLVTLNGLTVPSGSYGEIYMTPSDQLSITWTVTVPTYTYTQNVDGWWTINTNGCRWRECSPWKSGGATGAGAGCAFTLDAGAVQTSGGNLITINGEQSGAWRASVRLYGASTLPTANNTFLRSGFTGTKFRSIDIANYADTIQFDGFWHDSQNAGSKFFVGYWIGSAGTSGANATCNRQTSPGVMAFDGGQAGSAGAAYPIVLGYYNNATATVKRGVDIAELALGGIYADWVSPIVTDLRSTAVNDYLVYDVSGSKLYGSSETSYSVNGQANMLGVAPSTMINPGNATVTLAATFKMAGFGVDGTHPTTFTPRKTGIVKVTMVCQATTSVAADGLKIVINQGTGTPPSLNGAAAGSGISSIVQITAGVANSDYIPVTVVGWVSGLAVGTTIWADAALAWVTTGGNGILQNVNFIFEELAA